jgi:hypothetical protein
MDFGGSRKLDGVSSKYYHYNLGMQRKWPNAPPILPAKLVM